MVAQPGQGVHLRPDLHGAMGQRVLQGDRRMGREEADEIELPRLEAGAGTEALEMEDAEHAIAPTQRRDDEGRRVGAVAPNAASLARGQDLRDDAAAVG